MASVDEVLKVLPPCSKHIGKPDALVKAVKDEWCDKCENVCRRMGLESEEINLALMKWAKKLGYDGFIYHSVLGKFRKPPQTPRSAPTPAAKREKVMKGAVGLGKDAIIVGKKIQELGEGLDDPNLTILEEYRDVRGIKTTALLNEIMADIENDILRLEHKGSKGEPPIPDAAE